MTPDDVNAVMDAIRQQHPEMDPLEARLQAVIRLREASETADPRAVALANLRK